MIFSGILLALYPGQKVPKTISGAPSGDLGGVGCLVEPLCAEQPSRWRNTCSMRVSSQNALSIVQLSCLCRAYSLGWVDETLATVTTLVE